MKKKTVIKGIAMVIVVAVAICCALFNRTGDSFAYATIWSLLPPVVAIALALITKEVYSSLAIGIFIGALFSANFNLEHTINYMFFGKEIEGSMTGGMVCQLSDSYNVGIIIFLCLLGTLVALINKAGGSAAFGQFASKHIKTRVGAQLATVVLGVLIFVDDYFNCLTVGSVMRPVTDKHQVSRAKLAYIIDSTAAPVCIIAPVSSWAAAVTGSLPDDTTINGFSMFLRAIPYNLYALLAIVLMIALAALRFDYGPMAEHEKNAVQKNDLFTTAGRPYGEATDESGNVKGGKVIDLILPVLVLIAACIGGMIYSGGFFDKASEQFKDIIGAFANADASQGLLYGSVITLVFTFAFYMLRDVMSFKDFMDSLVEGTKNMIPAILILTFAWTLKGMTTDLLGAKEYVYGVVSGSAAGLQAMLPAIIFLIACGLSFATGTSWGTFGILIPIVCSVFPADGELLIISIAACLGGSVMGDNCSPISDTTIMASAGAQCEHVNHVSTQFPYAITVAAVSFVGYLLAGFVQNVWVVLPVSLILLLGTVFVIRAITLSKNK